MSKDLEEGEFGERAFCHYVNIYNPQLLSQLRAVFLLIY